MGPQEKDIRILPRKGDFGLIFPVSRQKNGHIFTNFGTWGYEIELTVMMPVKSVKFWCSISQGR